MEKQEISELKKIADDEEFKPVMLNDIPYENYYISNYGRLYSIYSHRILKEDLNKKSGYYYYKLSNHGKFKTITEHRLVALHFCERTNPDWNTVNHKDQIHTNDIWTNLEWCTVIYNNNYADKLERQSKTRQRKIVQYDKDNNPIKIWDGRVTIWNTLHYDQYIIGYRARKTTKNHMYKGYIWRYLDELESEVNI
ncbi:NUMOD4 domain-containing protein [Caproiciproducens sp.]